MRVLEEVNFESLTVEYLTFPSKFAACSKPSSKIIITKHHILERTKQCC